MSARASLLPGAALAALLAAAAALLQLAETGLFGHAAVDAIVLAILLGVVVRLAWTPGPRWEPGIRFAAGRVLEVAIVLLGASVELPALLRAGSDLLVAILAVVAAGLAGGYALGRALGLTPRLATLIAAGSAICGDSAVAAVAPVIGADAEDVAASTGFAAVLGVAVVLALPLLIPLLGLTPYQYGALAGMTVYAVPHALAAAFPIGALSGEVGTLVKLVRVLLLGPVVVFLAVRHGKVGEQRLAPGAFVPWFAVGFLVLGAAHSLGFIPAGVAGQAREISRGLTLAAMAALGLRVDVRVLRKVDGRVALAVAGTLVILVAAGVGVIGALGIG